MTTDPFDICLFSLSQPSVLLSVTKEILLFSLVAQGPQWTCYGFLLPSPSLGAKNPLNPLTPIFIGLLGNPEIVFFSHIISEKLKSECILYSWNVKQFSAFCKYPFYFVLI